MQRPFYPEPDGICHTYVLHPPSGVVGGDQLKLSATVMPGATARTSTMTCCICRRRSMPWKNRKAWTRTPISAVAVPCGPARASLLTGRYPQRHGLDHEIRNDLVDYGHRYSEAEYAISPEMTLRSKLIDAAKQSRFERFAVEAGPQPRELFGQRPDGALHVFGVRALQEVEPLALHGVAAFALNTPHQIGRAHV